MKILYFIPVLGFALLSASCQVSSVIDPMTLQPSTRCAPPGSAVVHYSGK